METSALNVTCAGLSPSSALIYKFAKPAGVVSLPTVKLHTVNVPGFISVLLCIYVSFFKIIFCAVIVPAIWFSPLPSCVIVEASMEQPGLRRRIPLYEKTAVSSVPSCAFWLRVIFSAVTEILFAFSLFVNSTSDAD